MSYKVGDKVKYEHYDTTIDAIVRLYPAEVEPRYNLYVDGQYMFIYAVPEKDLDIYNFTFSASSTSPLKELESHFWGNHAHTLGTPECDCGAHKVKDSAHVHWCKTMEGVK